MTTTALDEGTSAVQDAIDAGQLIATPQAFDETARFHVIAVPGFEPQIVDLDAEKEKAAVHPDRKTGSYTVHDAASFVRYVTRHATSCTELYADVKRLRMLAVIDGHGPTGDGLAGRGQHQVTFVLRATPSWEAWKNVDRKMLAQVDFAEHIEDRRIDIVTPTAADLLEIAQTLIMKKGVDFESQNRLRDGNTILEYRETTTAKAGQKGQLSVPEQLTLALVPFYGAARYDVTARLRTRLDGGHLALGVLIDNPEQVIETAFNDLVQVIGTELADAPCAPILAGWPNQ